jgi:hypothetical protein
MLRTNTMSYAMALAAGALGVAGAVATASASPSWAASVKDLRRHRRHY